MDENLQILIDYEKLTDYEKAIEDYQADDSGVAIEEITFRSDGYDWKCLSWRYDDGSCGFDIYDENGGLQASFILDDSTKRDFARFVAEQVEKSNKNDVPKT